MDMYDTTIEDIEPNFAMRYLLRRNGTVLTYFDVLELWQADANFRTFFTQLLVDSPFPAYRWETPPLRKSTAGQLFQFVLLNSPGFITRQTDRKTYEKYFTTDDTDGGIVSFINLGGDARLVVPSPRTDMNAYGHLAAFVRHAPIWQLDAFWRVVSISVKSELGDNPLWLSTAGGGVAWLHVRLDSRPKYYGYAPYKAA